jgi:hypothetical protein
MNKYRVALLLVISMLLVAGAAFAQTATTGAILGTVAQAGTPLPGVTVEVRSANLQGVRTEVTDATGRFRFNLLPPGDYTLTATLSGFNTVTQKNVTVGLNRTVTLEVAMSPQVSEQITVTGAAPVVDVSTAASGINITAQTMQSLPLGRNFTSAVQIAPGANRDATGSTVYGSTGAENEYIIDGLNTTGVSHGQNVKSVNFDFIQEVETITGGLNAEYGRMTGGVINAITKSGSNEFHGDVFGYNAGGALRSDPSYQKELPTSATSIGDIDKQLDYGANLGGFIMKDRLWFFGAYNRVTETDLSVLVQPLTTPNFSLPNGATLPTDITRDLYAAKLSLALTPSHVLNASVLGDPSESDGAQFIIAGPPSTFNGLNKTGGNDYQLRYSGVFGTNWNVNGSYGKHKEKNELAGPGTTTSQLQDVTTGTAPNIRSGGFVGFTNSEYDRDVIKLDVSSFLGNHTIKFGADQEKLKADVNRFLGGGDWIRKFCTVALVTPTGPCPAGKEYYRHEVYLNDQAPGFSRSNSATWLSAVANPLTVSPKTENTSFYIQDSWKLLPNLTLNAGVRNEEQKVGDRFGEWTIKINDNLSPRLGFIWDPSNNGRSKAYANYGRFYESIPMDINIRSFGGELSLDVNNFDPNSQHLTPDPAAPKFSATGLPSRILGAFITPVDPNLKGQYIDEYLLGYDYELAPNLAVGVKGTYRDLGRVIEDMLLDPATGDYQIANPGSGIGSTTGYLATGEQVPTPKAKRTFTGVELHAQKRFSNNYQFYASYLWSELKGNYDGLFQASTGQLDPNINSAYDYADFAVNANGLLSNDRTHQLKFTGSYTVPNGFAKGLDLGLITYWYSGTPLTAFGYASSYRNYEYYLSPRGTLGRGPSEYEADLHFGYPISFGGSRLNVLLDVFNVLDRQAIRTLDQRYNLSSQATVANPCPGIPNSLCNGDGGITNIAGTTQPAGSITNPRATATNPSFLTRGTSFTGQRSIRVGARFSF